MFLDHVEVGQLADPVRFVLVVDIVVALVHIAPGCSPVERYVQAFLSLVQSFIVLKYFLPFAGSLWHKDRWLPF